ncbi:MAG: response regulator [Verrucomicrobia bacterium]|jgi:PAS domain S-box-containing protein|nr:response regulator [Verrucomicrobiota bacterium]
MNTPAKPLSVNDTILIVDDNPDNLAVMKKVIAKALPDVTLLTCQHPEKVMPLLGDTDVAVALLDVQMPGIDGLELCKRIKSNAETQFMSVILITSHGAEPKMKARGLEIGADDFIMRPIDNAELTARVQVALRIHRSEAALRYTASDALRRFETMIRCSRDMMAMLDRDYVYLAVNDAYASAFGKAREDVRGHTVAQVFGEEFFETVIRPHAERSLAGEDVRYDSWADFPNIGRRFMDVSYSPYEDTRMKVAGFVVIARDITERKQAEEELRHFRSAVDASTDAIGMSTPEGTHRYQNEAMSKLFGLDMTEIQGGAGGPPSTIYADEAQGREVFETIMGGVPWRGEVEMLAKDGSKLNVLLRAYALKGDGEKVVGLVGVHTDITELSEQERQLEQSRKMESVGRLAGGVAHDFNNLLMGIMGYIDLCRKAVEPDHPIHQWLDEITSDAQRSASLTRQLLTFSRREPVTPQVLDTNDRISSMLKMLRHLIGENMKLVWQPGPVAGRIKMAPSHIEQIVVNLSVNARDAIGSGGIGKIEIATHNAAIDGDYCSIHANATPGDYVLLAISDDGCGMDAETLEHVFEPFFTTRGSEEGTGLGLATVYGIVKGNGGFIDIDTEPGRGTAFRVYLPRVEDEVVPEPVADSSVHGSEAVGGDETILLVEDEKSIRVTVQLFLQDMGYTVLAAQSPKVALELVAAHTTGIDLLITDVIMPGMNGRELADQLGSEFPDLKVLFMSGYSGDAIARDGILDEGVEFLSKPITRDALAVKVREMLDGQ